MRAHSPQSDTRTQRHKAPLLSDRRAAGDLADVCERHGAWLLAYGTLNGGFLSERWLDRQEPDSGADWSKMKYARFIAAAGGWPAFQAVLRAAAEVARKHGVSLANVATRWVLEQRRVGGAIIGARLGEAMHASDNRRLFSFALDADDRALLEKAFAATRPIPGDCGDEYRRPPFLTASGDLSHHLFEVSKPFGGTSAQIHGSVIQPRCHPERSEGLFPVALKVPRYARDDTEAVGRQQRSRGAA